MKKLALSLLCLFAPLAHADSELTEASIRSLYEQVAADASKRDIDATLAHMSDDVRIHISAPTGSIELDAGKYRQLLQQGWGGLDSYRMEVAIESIEIAADGQSATVKDTTKETLSMQGHEMSTGMQETASLRLIDGEPKIVRIEATIQP
ncbi:nuclear transport factor 2 family protein [Pseudomonas sp. Gutcm_11s]|uniref:nuclear transport factor 2 family protein n=1 Tax=Pseudomonas sp. Gutcm_11s TaxID=3026088 RepID=UPI002362B4A4|nr:nuclear transport factor 2 family protein [Pseudomonas sp. Gutcm_11s]MDD0843527.1 nuclear transport factor 2 family protein [Pseudomonas sp. Gutcm_11s]